MIVSKPKRSTLFSIGVFLLLTFSLFIYSVISVTETNDKTWWYLIIYTSGPIGLIVLIRILTSIKIITIRKEKFEFKVPFKFQKIAFDGKELAEWNHTIIKTYGGLYEELNFKLQSGKELSLSKQENTEYDKALNYMKKKFKKLQKESN